MTRARIITKQFGENGLNKINELCGYYDDSWGEWYMITKNMVGLSSEKNINNCNGYDSTSTLEEHWGHENVPKVHWK